MSIIIVDDDPYNLQVLDNILKSGGYQDVILAKNLKEAIHLANKGDDALTASGINLILINLQSQEAILHCQLLKSLKHYNEIPIIATSCIKDIKNYQKTLDIKIDECITDITNEAEVLMRIKTILTLKYEIKRRKALERNLHDMATQLEHSNNTLNLISSQDGLTGIANRRYFDNYLSNEWRRAMRNASTVSLIMIDIDFFKAYNDLYGHLKGDECLKAVAQEIQKTLKRSSDIAARYGGEEFAVVLPGTDIKGAMMIARLIWENVLALNIKHEASKIMDCVTISLGVASEIPSIGSTCEELISKADKALYKAKRCGRNRIEKWDDTMQENPLNSDMTSCNIKEKERD
ncbi:MAG: diguanylate cyclase [Thermodesulfovibrionales bacterium]|nr:diguanylate cyclase [Thermodesulfovibrionales bacterium]